MELYSKSGTLLMDISPNPSSVLTEEVGGECSVSLSFMQPVFRKLDVGDYIEVSGTRYTIRSPYRPKQKNTQAYEYSVKLYAPIHEAEDTLMLFTKGESTSEFSYDGSPREHLQLWVDNMNRRAGSKVWSIGTVITADNQVIDYRNMKCWEAAFGSSGIAATFGTEMWADGFVINLCRAERGEQVELGYMKGLTNLSQEENGELRFFTRLFPLGSTRNINASTYGSSRLQLPSRAKYVDKNADLYGIIEDTEESAFADIYPKYTGSVASVRTEEKTNEDGRKYTVYFFKDSGMDWNPEDCQIAGLDFMLRFQTGELAGRGNDEGSFQAAWHKDTKEWEIINVYPDESTQLPGGAIIPKPGDKYIPWNFALPQAYITAAEKAYEKAVNDYLAAYSFDTNKYNGTTDRNYIERNGTSLMLGQNVRLLSDKYFTSGHKDTRIIKVVRKLNDLSQATITCADEVGAGWKSSVDNSLSSLRYEVARQAEQYVYDVIKSFEGKTPSDKNIFSALKSLKTHLRKDVPDSTMYLQKFLGGIITTFLQSPEFVSGAMGHGFIIRQNEDGTTYAEVDKLLVRMKAVFQSLEIMKTELAGASFLFNASGARATITRVERIDGVPLFYADGKAKYHADGKRACVQPSDYGAVYRCYFLTDDGDVAIENRFHVGNLVRSQSFNIKSGVYEDVSNHYWWRLVTAVGDNWIDLSVSHCDEGSDIPQEGDVMVQLGDLSDTDYQSAIALSAYGNGAPSLVFYQGINSYSLAGRDVFSLDYDRLKKEVSLRSYGRAYIGDRDKKDFISYSQSEGLIGKFRKISLLTDNAEIDIGERIRVAVGKDDLSAAGLTITNNSVKINANQLYITDSSGNNPIGIFKWENGKPLVKAENIDVNNLTARKFATENGLIKLNSDGSGTLAGGRISWKNDGNFSFKTNGSNERIEISSISNTIEFRGSDGMTYLSMSFRDSNGSRTARINLNDGRGRVTGILPGSIDTVFFNDGGLIADERGEYHNTFNSRLQIYHKTKDRLVSISPNGIQFNDGGTIYKGFTGQARINIYDNIQRPVYKMLKIKNGIIYDLS